MSLNWDGFLLLFIYIVLENGIIDNHIKVKVLEVYDAVDVPYISEDKLLEKFDSLEINQDFFALFDVFFK